MTKIERILEGKVVSDKADKTIVVSISTRSKTRYKGKTIRTLIVQYKKSPIGIDSKFFGCKLIKSSIGLPTCTLNEPVIPKTMNIITNWKFDDTPHFSFNRL